jgi:uroporphyrinogen-III synthase
VKTVWVTRTDTGKPNHLPPDWKALNFPLLDVVPASQTPIPPKSDDVLIFTSGNAVHWFSKNTDKRDWTIYTVGNATADLAKAAGFKNVHSAGKDVAALRGLIAKNSALKTKRLYYASGQDVSGNLEVDLSQAGYNIVRAILYETHPIQYEPKEVRAAVSKNQPLTVFLYSPKGSQAFRALDLDFSCIETVSISENVDGNLVELALKSRKIADQPSHAAMIKHLA